MSQLDEYPRLELLDNRNIPDEKQTITKNIYLKDTHCVFGRTDKSPYAILDATISRHQCDIKQFGNKWTITDFSKFGTKLNSQKLVHGKETMIDDGDIIQMDSIGIYTYKFVMPERCASPAPKKLKLQDGVSHEVHDFQAQCSAMMNFQSRRSQQFSELQQRMQAAQFEQSQIQEEEESLHTSYKRKIRELEEKFNEEREKMEKLTEEGKVSIMNREKEREESEERLRIEKEELLKEFENEKVLLELKVEEQRKIENNLKEENDRLSMQIEAERKEFKEKLEEERRLLEENKEQTRRKVEEEKAELEFKYQEVLEKLKEQQENEKNDFNMKLEQGTAEQQKMEEEHQKIIQQLREQEESAARQLSEKQLLEQKLASMEKALVEKEQQQKALGEELARKEEEKLRELENLRAQQEAENQQIREEMKRQEQNMRLALDTEINKLKEEKLKLEADIRVEMNVESLENKNFYETELAKKNMQLSLLESKKLVLETKLADNVQEKEKMSETCLKAKQKVLEDVGEMMQSELQCQICSELFVIATTLNCTHTFCQLCITEWKQKKLKPLADCPVCRAPIHSENRSIVLDNFIDKMVENLSDEHKEQRKQLLLERKGRSGAAASTSGASTSRAGAPPQQYIIVQNVGRHLVPGERLMVQTGGNVISVRGGASTSRGGAQANRGGAPTNRGGVVTPNNNQAGTAGQSGVRQRGGRNNARSGGRARGQGPRIAPAPQTPAPAPPAPAPPGGPPPAVITIGESPLRGAGAPAASVRQEQPLYVSSDDDDEDGDTLDSDELVVPGLPTASYGGYGRCFNCGLKGHWSPGCPFGSIRR